MGKVNVSIDIPKNPDEIIVLGEDIVERHTESGANSPLNNKVDINSFAGKIVNLYSLFKQNVFLFKS